MGSRDTNDGFARRVLTKHTHAHTHITDHQYYSLKRVFFVILSHIKRKEEEKRKGNFSAIYRKERPRTYTLERESARENNHEHRERAFIGDDDDDERSREQQQQQQKKGRPLGGEPRREKNYCSRIFVFHFTELETFRIWIRVHVRVTRPRIRHALLFLETRKNGLLFVRRSTRK